MIFWIRLLGTRMLTVLTQTDVESTVWCALWWRSRRRRCGHCDGWWAHTRIHCGVAGGITSGTEAFVVCVVFDVTERAVVRTEPVRLHAAFSNHFLFESKWKWQNNTVSTSFCRFWDVCAKTLTLKAAAGKCLCQKRVEPCPFECAVGKENHRCHRSFGYTNQYPSGTDDCVRWTCLRRRTG